MKTADLHFHSIASDGSETPGGIAKAIAALKYTSYEDVLHSSKLDPVIRSLRCDGEEQEARSLEKKIWKSVEVAKGLNTVALTDHDSLLMAEEFLEAMRKYAPEKRVLIGAELTALTHDFPSIDSYAVHVLVYFHKEGRFDAAQMDIKEQREFFKELKDSYLDIINEAVDSNNYRKLNAQRQKTNEYFFGAIERIREEDLVRLAKDRVSGIVDPQSEFNLENHKVLVHHTDIAEAVARETGQDTNHILRLFRREGDLYIPMTPGPDVLYVRDLLKRLRLRSSVSPVKVKQGLAHPSTYVRLIAKNQSADADSDADHFYGSGYERSASEEVLGFVTCLVKGDMLDFLEAEYPRYTRAVPSKEKQFSGYADYVLAERDFTRRQQTFWKREAERLKIKISGGTDSHSREETPNIAYGLCDVSFDDRKVDILFSD